MPIDNDDVDLFFATGAKSSNSGVNARRERVIYELVDARLQGRGTAGVTGDRASLLESALWVALESLPENFPDVADATLTRISARGGLAHRHDFELYYESSGLTTSIPLEFKVGRSLSAYPQFLQVPARQRGVVTSSGFPSYAEYVHHEFGSELSDIAGAPLPSLDEYLRDVGKFTPPPGSAFFVTLKEAAKDRERDSADRLFDVFHRSADGYLSRVEESLESAIAWENLAVDFSAQSSKAFLMWDTDASSFALERIAPETLELAGSGRAEISRRTFLRTGLLLNTASGGQVSLRLVWRNRAAVQNPAWQIKRVS
ncbi:hypothetical protein [Demequina rhizosphaerae]|uniref:hypothetical protein n=1 Tax=Demequina rhizosphaerae TaxID=1638985 RepID=UPI0007817315|nr:hypothetical protein [Demequina rhizosphaerae]